MGKRTTAVERRRAVWGALNERQQVFLTILYDADQALEAAHARDGARGDFDRRPAREWRQIPFGYDQPILSGMTDVQYRLQAEGLHNQGNGSTLAHLADLGLIELHTGGSGINPLRTVLVTREGRAVFRASIPDSPDGPVMPTVLLSEHGWIMLAKLWVAGDAGVTYFSTTVTYVLAERHGFAARRGTYSGGHVLTDAGRAHYLENWAAYAQVYPHVAAPDPANRLEWPAAADRRLTAARDRYEELESGWRGIKKAAAAAREAAAAPVEVPVGAAREAPEARAAREERHQVLAAAQARVAQLADRQAAGLEKPLAAAARAWARLAGAAFAAAVAGTDPAPGMDRAEAAAGGGRFAAPVATGDAELDGRLVQLHAVAIGRPLPPEPEPVHPRGWKARRAPRPDTAPPPPLPAPGREVAAYAAALARQVRGGALLRTLHAAAPTVAERAG